MELHEKQNGRHFQETEELLIMIKPLKWTGYLHAHFIMK